MRHGLSLLALVISSGFFFAKANVFADVGSNSSTVDTAVEPPLEESSNLFVHGENCGDELAMCAQARSCFDHSDGCGENGSNSIAECSFVLETCQYCFPNSRCGKTVQSNPVPVDDEFSGTFVGETAACGPALALCESAGPCFDHAAACLADGSILPGDCDAALPCKPCFPYSRCGSGASSNTEEEAAVEIHESAQFVESDSCGQDLKVCEGGGPCFDHTQGCQEDGTVDTTKEGLENCGLALDYCIPCFPNSRCAGAKSNTEQEQQENEDKEEGEASQDGEVSDEDRDEGVASQDAEASELAASIAHCTTVTSSIIMWIAFVGICHFLQAA